VRWVTLQRTLASLLSTRLEDTTHSNFLALAVCASLQLSHQMGMLTLLLRLCAATSRSGNVDSVLCHNREARETCLSSLLGILLRLLCDAPTAGGCPGWRGQADRAVCRIPEGGRGSRAWCVNWRGESRRL
jgi:hypothetical protein